MPVPTSFHGYEIRWSLPRAGRVVHSKQILESDGVLGASPTHCTGNIGERDIWKGREAMAHVSRFVVLLCTSLVLFVSSPLTANAVLIDQFNFPTSYPDDSRVSPILGRYNVGAQTFTVGITGTLTGFDVPIYTPIPGETIDWQLRSTTNGVLAPFLDSTTIIASGTITFPPGSPAYSFPYTADMSTGFYAIDLSALNIFVHTGDQLAILIGGFNPGQEYDRWWGTSVDQYARGVAYENSICCTGNLVEYPWVSAPDMGWDVKDFYFATHVEPVPEPSTFLLLGSGLVALGGMAWRRRRS